METVLSHLKTHMRSVQCISLLFINKVRTNFFCQELRKKDLVRAGLQEECNHLQLQLEVHVHVIVSCKEVLSFQNDT